MKEERDWQARAKRVFELWLHGPVDKDKYGFAMNVTPAAGKTWFALAQAADLKRRGRIDKIVVVVPRRGLEDHWKRDAVEHNLCLNDKWHAQFGSIASDEDGVVVTYDEVVYSIASYRRLVSKETTLVILDEPHHGSMVRAWGQKITEAFQPASLKMLMSGTLFRTDKTAIPFLHYIDDVGLVDFKYDYKEALRDGVVRYIFFPRRGGTTEWEYRGKKSVHTFQDPLSKKNAQRRLRTATSVLNEWLPDVLQDADNQLQELRQNDNAGAIVFCEFEKQARDVVTMLEEIATENGREPSVRLIISAEEEDASERIRAFRESTDEWVVTIRQVSEGINIPRLRVGVYATAWVTELYFTQVVGRLLRIREDEEDPTAYLFIPDDSRLRELAEKVRDLRDAVLEEQDAPYDGNEDDEDEDEDDKEPKPESSFRPLAASSSPEGTIVGPETIPESFLQEAQQLKRTDPELALLPTPLLARAIYRDRQARGESEPTNVEHTPERTGNNSVRFRARLKDQRRTRCNAAAAAIAQLLGVKHGYVNGLLNALASPPVSNVRQLDLDGLDHRLKIIGEIFKTERLPEWPK